MEESILWMIVYIILFLIYIVASCIFGNICRTMAIKRGEKDSILWFLLGFCFGLIGIIITLIICKGSNVNNNVPSISAADELIKYKQLLDAGAITEEEYIEFKRRLL